MTRFVIYTRLSCQDRDCPDGGLAAQRRAIAAFLRTCPGGPHRIQARFRDLPEDRAFPGLQAALAECRASAAELLVARLDRLPFARLGYAPFLADPGVTLRVAALPHAGKAELSIHARRQAPEQKPRPPWHAAGAADGAAFPDQAARIVLPMRRRGATLRDIASALNRAGLTTASGTAWRPGQVSRLLQAIGQG
ncbi:serine integrase family protein [Paracoccus binzhouensis]|uniref:recombinase family protein n=1 Tax=Paracoccus binzhouensis TaxID=2796149 RepID=UPI0018EEFFF4|nr:recombinase family protein [Paracoccus binzhouensis]